MGYYVNPVVETSESRLLRMLAHLPLRLWLRRVHRMEVRGLEHVAAAGPAIFAANHASHLDAPILFAALPTPRVADLHSLAARDVFLVRRHRAAAAYLTSNAVPLDRRGAPREGMTLAEAALRAGRSVVIFPEGLRKSDAVIGPFKSGVGQLALRTGAPVIPAFIEGARRCLPKGSHLPIPGPIRVTFGPPLRFPPETDRREVARVVEAAVRRLADDGGEPPTGRVEPGPV